MTDLQSLTLMMASAQVVETSVNTNNSPSQDYTTNPDDHSNHNKIKSNVLCIYMDASSTSVCLSYVSYQMYLYELTKRSELVFDSNHLRGYEKSF